MINISRMTIMTMAFMLCLTCLVFSGTAFAERCVDNGDGTVTDNNTGLMWQKRDIDNYMDWDAAMSYASGLSLAGHSDWRLPTLEELIGLYHSPCKDMTGVAGSYAYFWSSTASDFSGYKWMISFFDGEKSTDRKRFSHFVLAVRTAQ